MTAVLFVFLPNLYSVIERLQCALAWFGMLIAMDLWMAYLSPPVIMSADCLKAVVPQWQPPSHLVLADQVIDP